MTEHKKIGLMGCGAVADYGHIPAIQATPGLKLQAVFDPNEETLKYIQEKFNIPEVFANSGEFFKAAIDAVSITSPAPCHKQNVLDCAEAGVPVLCEKPLCMDREEATVMIDAMAKAGLTLYSAFCYRFSPCALRIRELVAEKAIGEVKSLRLIYNWGLHGKYEIDKSGNKVPQQRRVGRMLEGGPMVDCGTHQIDLAKFWLGSEVTNFTANGAWVDEYEAPDHMWLHMDHANGAHTCVEMSYSYCHTAKNPKNEFIYELIGTEGVIRYDRANGSFQMENTEGSQEFDFHGEKSFKGLYEEWAKALVSGSSELLTSAEDGQRVVEIARTATNQVIEGRN